MSKDATIGFFVDKQPVSVTEITQARKEHAKVGRDLAERRRRLHINFMWQSMLALAFCVLIGLVSPSTFSWKIDSFVRIFALCVVTTFFAWRVFVSYQEGKAIEQGAAQLARLQQQWGEVDQDEHLHIASEFVFSPEVLQYVSRVNEQGRRLLSGEASAIRSLLVK